DVISRFFHNKSSFVRDEMEELSQIDYIKNLTIVAIVGEFGFGRVVAVGEYLLDTEEKSAEIAFSVNRDFQGKGIGRILIKKLAEAARENGISGMHAYTSARNKPMVRLFKLLPYKIQTSVDSDILRMSCKFDRPV
ncbi:MAG: GNAT family N-acetyltransferase, partial [Desulfobacterales bacterium]